MLAETINAVVGVDTHTDTHTACVVDRTGRDRDHDYAGQSRRLQRPSGMGRALGP